MGFSATLNLTTEPQLLFNLMQTKGYTGRPTLEGDATLSNLAFGDAIIMFTTSNKDTPSTVNGIAFGQSQPSPYFNLDKGDDLSNTWLAGTTAIDVQIGVQ